jgi:predicted nucleotidyltransferase
LAVLGDLPQQRRLHTVVGDLWRDPAVAALWLGGSLARGAGDAHSDVDLRIAVLAEAFDTERLPAAAEPLKAAAVAILPLRFGGKSVLFHMLLVEGGER